MTTATAVRPLRAPSHQGTGRTPATSHSAHGGKAPGHPATQAPACLEYLPAAGSNILRLPLDTFPFRLGRNVAANFPIPCGRISRCHAEIVQTPAGLIIRDLGSSNGTFVNGQRVEQARLSHGDVFHLADHEFRFLLAREEEELCHPEGRSADSTDPFLNLGDQLPASVLACLPHLKEMIRLCQVQTYFQPILHLATRQVVGYEALARGKHGKLSTRPGDLFFLAERCQLAGELSRACRHVAVAESRGIANLPALFLNMHPAEMSDATLVKSLAGLRANLPAHQRLVLEIHEQTVTDVTWLRRLRQQLNDLDIGLAYDDFGAGQSRLRELAEVPPDFVKLDMKLVRNLNQSSPRQSMVKAICRVAADLGVQVLAEGLESEAEAEVCRRLGCALGQGYLLGHPMAVEVPLSNQDTWNVQVECRQPAPGDRTGQ